MRWLIPFAMAGSLLTAPQMSTLMAQPKPAFARAPDALERVTWRTRTLVGDDRLTRWKLAIPDLGLTLIDLVFGSF
jgi:hypothetical protein